MLKVLFSILFGFVRAGSCYTGKCRVLSVLYLSVFYMLSAGLFAGVYVIAKNNIDAYYYNESTLLYNQLKRNTEELKTDNNLALYDGLCVLNDKRVFYTAWSIGLLLGVFLTVAGNVWITDITAVLKNNSGTSPVKRE